MLDGRANCSKRVARHIHYFGLTSPLKTKIQLLDDEIITSQSAPPPTTFRRTLASAR
jgi:hypothetical protein